MNFLSQLLSTSSVNSTSSNKIVSPLTRSAISDERFGRFKILWDQSLFEIFGDDARHLIIPDEDDVKQVKDLKIIPRDLDETSLKKSLRGMLECLVEEDNDTGVLDSTGPCMEYLLDQQGPLNILSIVALSPPQDDAFFRKQVLQELVRFCTDLIRNNVEDLRLLTHASIFIPLNKVLKHFVDNVVRMEMRMEWIQLIHGMCGQIAQEKSILLMFLDGEGISFLPLVLMELGNDDDVGQFAQKSLEYLTKTMEPDSEIEGVLLKDDRLEKVLNDYLVDASDDEIIDRIAFVKRLLETIPSPTLKQAIIKAWTDFLPTYFKHHETVETIPDVEKVMTLLMDHCNDALIQPVLSGISDNVHSWLLDSLDADVDEELIGLRFILRLMDLKDYIPKLIPSIVNDKGFAEGWSRQQGVSEWKRLYERLAASNKVPTHSFSLESLDFTSDKELIPIKSVGIRRRICKGDLSDNQAEAWNEKWLEALEQGNDLDTSSSPKSPTSPKVLPIPLQHLNQDESKDLLKNLDGDQVLVKLMERWEGFEKQHPDQIALHGALLLKLIQSTHTSLGEYLLFSTILHDYFKVHPAPKSLFEVMAKVVPEWVNEKQTIFPPGILSSVLTQAQQAVLHPLIESRKKTLEKDGDSRDWFWRRVVTMEEWLEDVTNLIPESQ